MSPYSCTGVSSAIPCTSGPWAQDLETLNSRQRLGQTLNKLRFRVRLSEYYNFGRIEPGRHGCFFCLENGHLRPQIIIFPRCAGFVKAAPYRARRKSSLTSGAARQKCRFLRKSGQKSHFHSDHVNAGQQGEGQGARGPAPRPRPRRRPASAATRNRCASF